MTNKRFYQISLTMINGIGDILARHLLETLGDVEAIFTEKIHLLEKVSGIGRTLATEIRRPEVFKRTEQEIAFIEKNKISTYFLTDDNYPKRLKECPDAPVLFYYRGNADLNVSHIISIVGTRNATEYGRDLTNNLIKDLAKSFPNMLIVSGLAYGIDIHAHKCAITQNLSTVGVLAHGLDRIYPQTHKNTAIEMLRQGGLLTDFPSLTNPDKQNFIKRNRIVAGLSDATIVVESAEKGGSLITADISFSYGREVFSFPGRISDSCSKGCNMLIQQNKAALITSASDLISAMCWDVSIQRKDPPKQAQFFFSENKEFDCILEVLCKEKELHINQLATTLNMPVFQLSSLLFELEMNNVVVNMPGNIYRLV